MARPCPALLLLLLAGGLLLCAPRAARAYPAYFVAANSACGAQPAKAFGRHKAPVADQSILFTVQGPPGSVGKRFCPGAAYAVSASWPEPRNALLSASAGAFDGAGGCRVATTSRVPSVSGTFRVPCGAADGSRVSLRVTSATGGSGGFLQNGVTWPVFAGCAAPACRGARAG